MWPSSVGIGCSSFGCGHTHISCGFHHICALVVENDVCQIYTFGANDFGQLGYNIKSKLYYSTEPKRVIINDDDPNAFIVELSTGAYNVFKKKDINLSEPLKSGHIYYVFKRSKSAIEAFPVFKFDTSPQNEKGACYFYSRTESKKTEYVSYYYEQNPSIEGEGRRLYESISEIIDKNQ